MYKVSKICIEVVAVFACMFFAVSPAYAEGMAMSIDVVETEIAEQPSTADKTEAQAEEVEDETESDQVEVEKPSAEPEKKAETVTEPEAKAEEVKTTETQVQKKTEANASTATSTNNIAMQCTTPKNGWVTENGKVHYYNKSKIQTGWVVNDSYKNYGLQRYWMGEYGDLVTNKLAKTDANGSLTYCSKAGYVARNKFKESDGKFYLANNDGKLESSTGWMVTGKYDGGGLQRYYIDASTHSVKIGFFKVSGNLYHGDTNLGYVVRGKTRYGNGMLLSNNEGVIYTKNGWLVTGNYDGGGLERYYIDNSCAGYSGAHLGEFWVDSNCYYGLWDQGYVQRNCFRARNNEIWWANNDGVQTYYVKKCCGDDNVNFRIAYLWKDTMGGLWGDTARRAFDYVKNFRYITGSTWPSGDWAPWMAMEMLNNGGGNCYRYAALFTMMIRAAGFNANAISGYHNYGGVTYAHGWTEVYWGGQTYVCDPDGAHEQPGRNWYWVTYNNAPLAYRK